jgi:adenylate kinase
LIIVLLGPPGAGKGTQAEQIKKRYGLAHVSTGDMFRAATKQESELGRTVRGYLESGALVPDKVTSRVVADRLSRPDCDAGVMLDGYPRTVGQAEALDGILTAKGASLDAVAYFDVTEETSVERLSGRLTCPSCGAGYHRKYMPPKQDETCDKCGAKLVQRADDKEETIRDRLKVYASRTESLVAEYDRRELLRRIDANVAPEEVTKAVFAALDAVSSGGRE